jgi:radical SAM superfamily enzyme YgiQ (UPF0313 family)
MRITLISPASTRRPMDSDWKTHMAPPLGLLVVGALSPPEHRVQLVDENVEPLATDDHPDLVGITVKVDTVHRAAQIASHYRRRDIPVVLGGIHPTACPEACGALADSVVVGEAERLWPQVLRDVENGSLRREYRHAARFDPADTPMPRWALLEGKDYLFTNILTIGHGCPWRCEFCYKSANNITAGYQPRAWDRIRRDIESLGTSHVMFIDDNFIGSVPHARRIVRNLRTMNLTWHTAVSADIGQQGTLIEEMAEAGCQSLFIGFESLNARSLAACRKSQNRVEAYEETIRRVHASGMMVNASIVFGFDTDGPRVFEDTVRWLIRSRVETMTAHILTPYPGTRLHAQLLAQGRITDTDLRHYNTAHCVFAPRLMTAAELERGHRWAYDELYSWPNIVRRLPVDRRQRLAYLQFNVLYRKCGRLTCRLGRIVGMRRLARLAKALAYPAHSVARDRPEADRRSALVQPGRALPAPDGCGPDRC